MVFKRKGRSLAREEMTVPMAREARRLFRRGHTYVDLAKRYGVSTQAVRRACSNAEVGEDVPPMVLPPGDATPTGLSPSVEALSQDEVAQIRTRYIIHGANRSALAKKYGVTPGDITDMAYGRTRRDAPGPINALTPQEVIEVHKLLSDGTFTQKDIAEAYEVLPHLISQMKAGTAYPVEDALDALQAAGTDDEAGPAEKVPAKRGDAYADRRGTLFDHKDARFDCRELTRDQVLKIRRDVAAEKMTQKEAVEMTGLTQSSISGMVRGDTYKDIGGPRTIYFDRFRRVVFPEHSVEVQNPEIGIPPTRRPRGGSHKLTKEQRDWVKRRYEVGDTSFAKLARLFDVSSKTIWRAIGRPERNGSIQTRNFDDQTVVEIRRRYATGEYIQRELADDYDVHRTTISQIVRGDIYQEIGGPRTLSSAGGHERTVVNVPIPEPDEAKGEPEPEEAEDEVVYEGQDLETDEQRILKHEQAPQACALLDVGLPHAYISYIFDWEMEDATELFLLHGFARDRCPTYDGDPVTEEVYDYVMERSLSIHPRLQLEWDRAERQVDPITADILREGVQVEAFLHVGFNVDYIADRFGWHDWEVAQWAVKRDVSKSQPERRRIYREIISEHNCRKASKLGEARHRSRKAADNNPTPITTPEQETDPMPRTIRPDAINTLDLEPAAIEAVRVEHAWTLKSKADLIEDVDIDLIDLYGILYGHIAEDAPGPILNCDYKVLGDGSRAKMDGTIYLRAEAADD